MDRDDVTDIKTKIAAMLESQDDIEPSPKKDNLTKLFDADDSLFKDGDFFKDIVSKFENEKPAREDKLDLPPDFFTK